MKVDGRNLARDALCEVCGIDSDSNRARLADAALNDSKANGGTKGIRTLAWLETGRWFAAKGDPEGIRRRYEEPGGPEAFERALVGLVRRKASLYRRTMPGVFMTPTALRDHWLDLELAPERRDGGLTPSEIMALP